MALLKCEDCGKDVSSKANACPNCGCPVKVVKEVSRPPHLKEKRKNATEENTKGDNDGIKGQLQVCESCDRLKRIKKICPLCGYPDDNFSKYCVQDIKGFGTLMLGEFLRMFFFVPISFGQIIFSVVKREKKIGESLPHRLINNGQQRGWARAAQLHASKAEEGNTKSQKKLAKFYCWQLRPRDNTFAYAWFKIAGDTTMCELYAKEHLNEELEPISLFSILTKSHKEN